MRVVSDFPASNDNSRPDDLFRLWLEDYTSRIVDETGLAVEEIEFNYTDLRSAWMDNKDPIDCADAELSTWPGESPSKMPAEEFRERLKMLRKALGD